MTWRRLIRSEFRKLTSTRLAWGFIAVFVALSAINAGLVIFATEADGSKELYWFKTSVTDPPGGGWR